MLARSGMSACRRWGGWLLLGDGANITPGVRGPVGLQIGYEFFLRTPGVIGHVGGGRLLRAMACVACVDAGDATSVDVVLPSIRVIMELLAFSILGVVFG